MPSITNGRFCRSTFPLPVQFISVSFFVLTAS